MSTMDVEPRARRRGLVWSGVVLALPLLAALPVFALWGIVLFAVGGDAGAGVARGWSELLIWPLPLAIWIAALVTVIVLAARRRRTLRAACIGAAMIAACWAVGILLPLVVR